MHGIALKIGNGAVTFSAELVLEHGSTACDTISKSLFEERPSFSRLIQEGDVAPTWLSR
jgi:hypothetical protein